LRTTLQLRDDSHKVHHHQPCGSNRVVTNTVCYDKGQTGAVEHYHLTWRAENVCIIRDEAIYIATLVQIVKDLPVFVVLDQTGIQISQARDADRWGPR